MSHFSLSRQFSFRMHHSTLHSLELVRVTGDFIETQRNEYKYF